MTTGRIIKLIAFFNHLSVCLNNINFIENEYNEDTQTKRDAINIRKDHAKHYINANQYDGSDITVCFDPDSYCTMDLNHILHKYSGDVESCATLREEYKPSDEDHQNPTYVIGISIDNEYIAITKNGWK